MGQLKCPIAQSPMSISVHLSVAAATLVSRDSCSVPQHSLQCHFGEKAGEKPRCLCRERAAGYYATYPFALAQFLIEVPYVLAQSVLYAIITYFMIYFYIDAGTDCAHVLLCCAARMYVLCCYGRLV